MNSNWTWCIFTQFIERRVNFLVAPSFQGLWCCEPDKVPRKCNAWQRMTFEMFNIIWGNVFVRWAEVSTYVCLLWLLYCKSNLLCSKQRRKDAFQEVLRNTLHSISFNNLYTFRRYWESSIAFPLLLNQKKCFEKVNNYRFNVVKLSNF